MHNEKKKHPGFNKHDLDWVISFQCQTHYAPKKNTMNGCVQISTKQSNGRETQMFVFTALIQAL